MEKQLIIQVKEIKMITFEGAYLKHLTISKVNQGMRITEPLHKVQRTVPRSEGIQKLWGRI